MQSFPHAAVDEHIPKSKARNIHDHPWIDSELLFLIKKKNKQRDKARKSGSSADKLNFIHLRSLTTCKQLISKKKKDHANKIKASLTENPKRFWSYVKASTSKTVSPNFIRDGQSFITNICTKANMLNTYFHSVFSPAKTAPVSPEPPEATGNTPPSIQLSISEVTKVLEQLDPNKACGPDGIPGALLKNTAQEIAPSLCRLFNLSLSLGSVPLNWKRANVTPVFKKDDPSLVANYRPISLLCIVSKTLERCVFNHCYPVSLPVSLYHLQHGFIKGRSTVTQLLVVYHDILEHLG